jgi:hypothetical protein
MINSLALKKLLFGSTPPKVDMAKKNLRGFDFLGVDLSSANFMFSNLRSANFNRTNLTGASFIGADLRGSYLIGANLTDADFTGANLRHADLEGANLADAYLADVKEDLFSVLGAMPGEALRLRADLQAGRVDGITYSSGFSAAKYWGCEDTSPNIGRPAEVWLTAIRLGDTPNNSQIAKITMDWLDSLSNAP